MYTRGATLPKTFEGAEMTWVMAFRHCAVTGVAG
jgi:hypothetical protein